jgi:ferric-dicitrate binding protein FerR (iron transport regulator)
MLICLIVRKEISLMKMKRERKIIMIEHAGHWLAGANPRAANGSPPKKFHPWRNEEDEEEENEEEEGRIWENKLLNSNPRFTPPSWYVRI